MQAGEISLSECLSAGVIPSHGADFSTTHWSVVRRTGESDPDMAATALEALCRRYWLPVYAFLRRQRGATHHEAEDLTQAFFAHLLARETLRRARQERGRFRNFLLGALDYFTRNARDHQRRLKRGGDREVVSLDAEAAEQVFAALPAVAPPPDHLFERQWALALVRQALDRLARECVGEGKAALFRSLEPALTEADTEGLYADCAARLGMTPGAARVALHRLRVRFRELLRAEVAETVSEPGEVDEELRHLLAAFVN